MEAPKKEFGAAITTEGGKENEAVINWRTRAQYFPRISILFFSSSSSRGSRSRKSKESSGGGIVSITSTVDIGYKTTIKVYQLKGTL